MSSANTPQDFRLVDEVDTEAMQDQASENIIGKGSFTADLALSPLLHDFSTGVVNGLL